MECGGLCHSITPPFSLLSAFALFAVSLLVASNSYSFVLVRRQLSELEGAETHIRLVIKNSTLQEFSLQIVTVELCSFPMSGLLAENVGEDFDRRAS